MKNITQKLVKLHCVDFNQFFQDHLYSLRIKHLLEASKTTLMSSMTELTTSLYMKNSDLSDTMLPWQ